MISASDSFIQYLNVALGGDPPVAWIRATSLDPTSSDMQMDALNVSILTFSEKGTPEDVLVSLDLIGSDERMVLGWTKTLRTLLMEQQYTPELDYEANGGASPVATGYMVSWHARDIDFQIVRSQARYVHVNATFPITHVRE